MIKVNYKVRWFTRSGVGEPVKHEGRMIAILSGYPGHHDPDGGSSSAANDRAVVIEANPPNEIIGTRFRIVDIDGLQIIEGI